jgi:hypothetical protein
VKLSREEPLQKGVVRHQMAIDFYDKEVRVDRIDNFGNRQVIQTYPPAFDADSRAARVVGGTLAISVSYVKNCTVEIYLDGNIIAAYTLKNGEDPVKSSLP